MKDYKEFVVRRLRFLDDLIAVTKNNLKNAPPGRLLVRNRNGKPQYYHLDSSASVYDKYISATDEPLIRALAQKEYELKVLECADLERKALLAYAVGLRISVDDVYSKVLSDDNSIRIGMLPENAYLLMPESKRCLITPPTRLAPDDLYVKEWSEFKYTSLPVNDDEKVFRTERGEMVRSKSELIIANTLFSFGVPYRYECPLILGPDITVYPDFTPLNVRLRKEYYWEHLGLLSDPEYLEKSVRKLNRYENAGYYPGDRLLITRETAQNPLSTESVKGIIRRYLL